MAAAEQIVLRYPARRHFRMAVGLVVLLLLGFITWALVDAARHEREVPRIAKERAAVGLHPAEPKAPWALRSWPLLALLAFDLALGAWRLGHDFLLTRRGLVRVARAGLDVTSVCGCPRHVDWSQVREVSIRDLRSPGRVRLWLTEGPPVSLPSHLERLGDVLAALTRRAGLTEVTRKWWGTLYTRPSP
jgi:hypothetical protein